MQRTFETGQQAPLRRASLLLIFAAFFFLYLEGASCEERELKTEQTDKVDAVLVLDTSGSMRITDPLRLRDEGAKLFVQFLKSGDRLGIVEFSNGARIVRPLSDYDPSQAEAVNKSITDLGNAGEYTNILEGLKVAQSLLTTSPREHAAQSIVLLSDGKMDPEPAAGSAPLLSTELGDVELPGLKTAGIKVYTLYFSDQADKDLLKEIAANTDGINWFTPSAEKIHESFADLFLAVKKPQIVPLTKKGFRIDADVQEATFYINREDATGEPKLDTPSGKEIDHATVPENIKWFSGQKFDVVTVTQPESGDWQISGVSTTDGFATVLTNLKLITDWPANISADEKVLLQARLYESEKPIALPEMTGVIKYAFQVTPTDKISEPIIREFLNDEGKDGDKIAKDGIFSKEITIADAGEYRLRILARAPTFERNQQIPFRVKPSLIRLSVVHQELQVAPTKDAETPPAGEMDIFRVELDPEVNGYKKVSAKLFAVDEKRDRYEIPLQQSAEGKLIYLAPAALLPADGEFTLKAVLEAEGKRGKDVKVSSKDITYNKVPVEGAQEATKVVVTHEKPKEEKESPLLGIILVTLLNGAGGATVFLMLKKLKGATSTVMPVFEPLDRIHSAIVELQGKLALVDVDLNHPMFTDSNYEVKPIRSGNAGGGTGAATIPAQPQPSTEPEAKAESMPPEDSAQTNEPQGEAGSTEEPPAEGSGEE